MEKVYVIVPAFNEAKAIGKVIEDIHSCGFENIIVVDDGSDDGTDEIARNKGCIVVSHLINRGKGAATQTGFEAAKILGVDYAVTIDADGQHNPLEIESMIIPLLQKKCDVVLGSRFLMKNDIPFSRQLVNKFGNILTYIFYGISVTDSQSGFRAYNKKALGLIDTTFDRYEFESELLQQVNIHKLKLVEVPITVSYSEYSMNKWKDVKNVPSQNFMNGFKIFFRMVIRSITT